MYNIITVNPSYAGSREYMVINFTNRNQWIGIDGAPKTQTITTHTGLSETKLGVGLSIVNDKIFYCNYII